MKFKIFAVIFLCYVLLGCQNFQPYNPDRGFGASIEGALHYGSQEGHLQTPMGGGPETTMLKEPELDEIGIDEEFTGKLRGSIEAYGHGLYGQWRIIRSSGQGRLERDLISQGTFHPAGAFYLSRFDMDWVSLGYSYYFEYAATSSVKFLIKPLLEFFYAAFEYELVDEFGNLSHRSYSRVNFRGGIEVEARLVDSPFGALLRFITSPPIKNTPVLLSTELQLRYRLIETDWIDNWLYVGVSYDLFEYEDNQTVPNYLEVQFGPAVTMGLEIRY